MVRRRFAKKAPSPNSSTWITIVLMGGLLVGIFAAGDNFADKLSKMFASPPAEEGTTEELPRTLEPQAEDDEESEGVEPVPSAKSSGEHVNRALRDACEVALQTIAR